MLLFIKFEKGEKKNQIVTTGQKKVCLLLKRNSSDPEMRVSVKECLFEEDKQEP